MADTDTDKGTADDSKDDGDKVDANEVEKWKAQARKHEARAKENAKAAERLAEIEESSKSDLERAQAAAAAAEKERDEAKAQVLRYEVAAAKGVPAKLVKFLTGADETEISASADDLLEATGNKSTDTGDGGDGDASDTDKDKGPTKLPRERMRGGADTSDAEPEESDPAKLAESLPRIYG